MSQVSLSALSRHLCTVLCRGHKNRSHLWKQKYLHKFVTKNKSCGILHSFLYFHWHLLKVLSLRFLVSRNSCLHLPLHHPLLVILPVCAYIWGTGYLRNRVWKIISLNKNIPSPPHSCCVLVPREGTAWSVELEKEEMWHFVIWFSGAEWKVGFDLGGLFQP